MLAEAARHGGGGGGHVSGPIVVKLGGSLFQAGGTDARPRCGALLEILARAGRPVVIVPGGGVFADCVRSAQTRLGLSDPAAHRMALLAMHQMASVIVDLQPTPGRMILAGSLDDLARSMDNGMIPVWQPLPMLDAAPDLPLDWSITSDGLAAWLGAKIGAERVVLVKSVAMTAGASAERLMRDGVVDPMFGPIISRAGLAWSIIGRGDEERLAALVEADMQPGVSC